MTTSGETDANIFSLFSSQLNQTAMLQHGAKKCGKVQPSE